MDSIKDFLSELKDRVSNPLFASFVISWIFWNWDIVLALTLYKRNELIFDGYFSYFDYVNKNSSWSDLWMPVGFALIYTSVYPWFRALIKYYNSRIESISDTKILEKTGDAMLPVSILKEKESELDKQKHEYAELNLKYKPAIEENKKLSSRNQQLESNLQILTNEKDAMELDFSENQSKLEHLTKEVLDLKATNKDSLALNEKWSMFNSIASLNGEYNVLSSWVHAKDSKKGNQRWHIVDGVIYVVLELTTTARYEIIDIQTNLSTGQILGQLKLAGDGNIFFPFFKLQIVDSLNKLEGRVGEEYVIMERRHQEFSPVRQEDVYNNNSYDDYTLRSQKP